MPRRRRLELVVALASVLVFAPPSIAGWQSLGNMPAPSRDGSTLVFRNEQGTVAISALAPHLVRVRFQPGGALGRDHSYAIASRPAGDAAARIDVRPQASTLSTAALRVTVRHAPFRIAFATADGQSLDEDDPERGVAFAGTTTRVWKRLREDEHVYGFGEKTGDFDKRGRYRGGYSFAMWNSDTYAYGDDTDPLYVSVPFYMVLRNGRAHGIFLDNTFRTSFDVGKEDPDLLSFGAVDGELDYYLIDGPTPKDVVRRYTELTGRMPLPPRWSLGYNQCRYSYWPESRVRFIADNFRERRIPADVIWLDIHYQQGYNPFTFDRQRFPDPAGLMRDLHAKGFRVVTIVDPHPKKEKGSPVYDSGLAGGHFVKNPDGSVYEGPVWPSNAEKDPAPSVFPDFTRKATREWWGSLFKFYTDLGVDGIWNDMNEPAVFVDPAHTMPPQVRFDGEGQPTDHREAHNVYGMLMTQGTFEGLERLRPNQRPFVLTRASYAGGQRWGAVWPGDNVSDWSQMRTTIPMFLGMGLSGFSFVGSDIGGFAEFPSAELFTRWMQLGVFYPFMRTHTTFGTPDQEPWSYGTRHEDINRRAIEMRYELLPQIYSVMEEASRTGVPALRPLLLEYPDDPQTWGMGDQFLFGSDLLVAPVLREAVLDREVYLPKGAWYDYWTGRRLEGGRRVRVPLTLDRIPVFVRAGSVLFRQPVVQHTGEMAGQALRVLVHAGDDSESTVYEDDGATHDYRRGAFLRRRVTSRKRPDGLALEVSAPEGSHRPAARGLVVEVRGLAPSSVTVGGQPLSRVAEKDLAATASGWTVLDDQVVVKVPDTFGALSIVIAR